MKIHKLTFIETPYESDIKEGGMRIVFEDGLIKDIAKRVNGELKSMLHKDLEVQNQKTIEVIEQIQKTYTSKEISVTPKKKAENGNT